MRRNFCGCFAAFLVLTYAVGVQAQFQLQVGGLDQTVTGENRWPGAEDPTRVIDTFGQKYLNFAGDEFNPDGSNVSSGFLVQPIEGSNADDVATSITFWTANDAVQRDPAAYQLFGSNSGDIPALERDETVVTGLDPGDVLSLDLFTLISEGDLALPDSRNPGGEADLDDVNSQTIMFDNTEVYDNYLVLFPELKDRNGQNSMQIAEVQLNYDGVDIFNGVFDEFDPVVGLAFLDTTPPDQFTCSPFTGGEQAPPGQGFFSVREWQIPSDAPNVNTINSLADAIAAIDNPDLQCADIIHDGFAETINFADPQATGGGFSVTAPKQPFFSDTDAADDDFILRARGTFVIPEGQEGDWTFGVDGDDGFQLSIDGQVFLEAPNNTGNALGVAGVDFIDLDAGEHDIELIWYERGGGAFVELFAAQGDFEEFADGDFSPIGFAGSAGVQGTTPTVPDGWTVRTVDSVDGAALNSLADTEAALAEGDEIDSGTFDVVAFGNAGRGDEPLDGFGTDDFALEATGTIVVEEDGDYIFGFNSDDGGQLCITGADFTVFNENGNRTVSGDGECLDFDANTGNSNTFGTTFLAAGEYEARHIMWERGGGDNTAVSVSIGTDESGVSAAQLLGVEANDIDTGVAAGLQLVGVEVSLCNADTLGDLDENGTVEFADFLVLSQNFGQDVADHSFGDVDCSGTVEFADFLVLSQNFGQTVGGAQSVPEPSSLALLGFAGLALGFFRRRR